MLYAGGAEAYEYSYLFKSNFNVFCKIVTMIVAFTFVYCYNIR